MVVISINVGGKCEIDMIISSIEHFRNICSKLFQVTVKITPYGIVKKAKKCGFGESRIIVLYETDMTVEETLELQDYVTEYKYRHVNEKHNNFFYGKPYTHPCLFVVYQSIESYMNTFDELTEMYLIENINNFYTVCERALKSDYIPNYPLQMRYAGFWNDQVFGTRNCLVVWN